MGAELSPPGLSNPVPAQAAISTSLKWGGNGELSPGGPTTGAGVAHGPLPHPVHPEPRFPGQL